MNTATLIDIQSDGMPDNDWLVTNGDLGLVTDTDAINQALLQNLQFFYGEWFLNTQVGVPYMQFILVKNPNLDVVQAILTNAILQSPGIEELLSFDFDYSASNRFLSISFEAQSTTGDIISQTISVPGTPQGGV